jgi:hypothetical protein
MAIKNPLAALLADWLPAIDAGVLAHRFADHGRDYLFVLQASMGPRRGTGATIRAGGA